MARLSRVLSAAVVGASAAMLPVSAHAQHQARGGVSIAHVTGSVVNASSTSSRSTSPKPTPAARSAASSATSAADRFAAPWSRPSVRRQWPARSATGRAASRSRRCRRATTSCAHTWPVSLRHAANRSVSPAPPLIVPQLQLRRIEKRRRNHGQRRNGAAGASNRRRRLPAPAGRATRRPHRGKDAHPHSETAWRLRHIRRSILKSDSGSRDLLTGDEPEIAAEGSFFGKRARWRGQLRLLLRRCAAQRRGQSAHDERVRARRAFRRCRAAARHRVCLDRVADARPATGRFARR